MRLRGAGTHVVHIFSQNGTVCHNLHAVQKAKDKLAGDTAEARSPDAGSLRERKHEFVCREIERAAWDLFTTIGFDRATIETISRNAGVSRRTFFRYFPSKEALVSFSIQDLGERIAQRFASAPARQAPLTALENAMLTVMQEEMKHEERPSERVALLFEEPELRGRFLRALALWVPALSGELERRGAYRGDAARCALVAAFYCTALDQAHMRWFREPNRDLVAQLKRAFRQLREVNSAMSPG